MTDHGFPTVVMLMIGIIKAQDKNLMSILNITNQVKCLLMFVGVEFWSSGPDDTDQQIFPKGCSS